MRRGRLRSAQECKTLFLLLSVTHYHTPSLSQCFIVLEYRDTTLSEHQCKLLLTVGLLSVGVVLSVRQSTGEGCGEIVKVCQVWNSLDFLPIPML